MREVWITGMGAVSAAGPAANSMAPLLREGRIAVTREISGWHARAPLASTGKESRRIDRGGRLFLAAAREAWNSSGLGSGASLDPRRAGVIEGSSVGAMGDLLDEARNRTEDGARRVRRLVRYMPGAAGAVLAQERGIGGPVLYLSAGSVSATVAIGEAFLMIAGGRLDMAVAGGGEAPLHDEIVSTFREAGILSDDEEWPCRPFDLRRCGTVLGEGGGAVVLESADHAKRRGAAPIAVLRGYSTATESCGMVAADAAGIPFDMLLPNVYPLPTEGMPPFGLGLQPARGPLERLRDRIILAVGERYWDSKGLGRLNALRGRHGLAPLPHFLDQARGARRHLVLTSTAFDFPATLPANVRYVGPVLDDPLWAETPWTPPRGNDPLVLVSMSSTFQDQVGCLRRVAEALGTLPVRGLVTTGPAIDAASVNSPPNVTVVPSAPHRQVLRHAAVLVTHGGHGTAMKALAAGVPMILMPHGRDQPDTAARVTARGAGITLRRTATPQVIADAVRRLLQDTSYRQGAQRLGEAVRRDAASDALIYELEDLPAQ